MSCSTTVLNASHYTDPEGVVVNSGRLLARAIVKRLALGEDVAVDLHELPGVSSSYFNILFLIVRDELGPEALSRISLNDDSSLLHTLFERSRQAALDSKP